MRRRQRLLLFLIAIAAAAGFAGLREAGTLRRLELDTVDARFSIRGDRAPARDIVLVLVDEKTLQDLNERFPFRRRLHAQALDRLRRAGARVIAYDVQFTEPTNVEDDNRLIEAVARDHPVLLAASAVDKRGRTNVLGGGELLRQIKARVGNVHFPLDSGGVFRRVPYEVQGLEHFAVVAAELSRGEPVDPAPFAGRGAWIDYAGPPGTYPRVSFSDLLRGRVPSRRLRGKVVIVGASVPALPDLHVTSTTGNGLMTGAEIIANAIDTVRRGAPLRSVAGGVDIALIVLLALLTPLLALRLTPLRATLAALAGGALYVVATQLAFESGRVVALSYPVGALLTTAAGGLAVHYLGATVERERTRALFARFVPEDVVGTVLERTDSDLRLGGERREATVLFSDLRGFTSWAEQREPDEVIRVLNRFLEAMSDAIMDHGGTLVAFMGDGIMAVFGAPLDQPDHADRALAAAREMAGPRMNAFNAWLREKGLGEGFRLGIGLHTGVVMSGNVGSERRVEYTAIGDTTNTAARLEGLTKEHGVPVIVSEATRAALQADTDGLRPLGRAAIRGRQGEVELWTLDGGTWE